MHHSFNERMCIEYVNALSWRASHPEGCVWWLVGWFVLEEEREGCGDAECRGADNGSGTAISSDKLGSVVVGGGVACLPASCIVTSNKTNNDI